VKDLDLAPGHSGWVGGGLGWLLGPGGVAETRRVLLLILFPALVLAWTVHFDFVFDDNIVVLEDPLVVRQFSPRQIFGSEVRVGDVALGYYRPLITFSYRIDRALWGLNPAGYHLTNLLWHLLATFLVYQVALRTTGRLATAWAGAMLFAVLPAHTEAIGWIQGRVDLVSATFVLVTLLALVKAQAAPGSAGWRWAAVAGLTFLAALLSKESSAALPLAWAVWEISVPKTDRWRERFAGLASRFLPILLAGVAYWLLRRWAVDDSLSFPLSLFPVHLRALALVSVLAEYGRILLFPDLTLNFFQTLRVTPAAMRVILGLLVVVVLGGGLAVAWRRARPLFPWAAWVPVMLLPALFFILHAQALERGFFTAERFLYLPSVGWCILLGSLVATVLGGQQQTARSAWGLITVGGVVLGYAGLTLIRLAPWANAVDLYVAMRDQAHLPPAVRVLVHNNLGEVYLEHGEFSSAEQEFRAALRLKPDYAFAHNNLGVLLIRQGHPTEARRWIETAIRLDPNYSDAYGNLGAAYEAAGDPSAARQAFEAGLRIAPGSVWLVRGLGRVNGKPVPPRVPRAGTSP
jgi:protein O-mannosyl-transferase